MCSIMANRDAARIQGPGRRVVPRERNPGATGSLTPVRTSTVPRLPPARGRLRLAPSARDLTSLFIWAVVPEPPTAWVESRYFTSSRNVAGSWLRRPGDSRGRIAASPGTRKPAGSAVCRTQRPGWSQGLPGGTDRPADVPIGPRTAPAPGWLLANPAISLGGLVVDVVCSSPSRTGS
jgi:hypothetical protein